MYFDKSFLLPIVASLALTQVCQALPQATKAVRRNDTAPDAAPTGSTPLFDVFGEKGHPTIADLEAASVPADNKDNLESGVDKVQVILLGFIKCSPGWIESWFPNKEETARYTQHEIPPGAAYVLTYDPEHDTRWKVSVKLESLGMVAQIVKDFTGHITEGMAWWPWALLQGVLDHGPWSPDERALDLDLITQAFSAHRRIHRTKDKINDAQVDETQLWDIVSKEANATPIWIELKDNFFNVMSTFDDNGEKLIDGAWFVDGKIKHQNYTTEEVMKDLVELTHLEGLPRFVPGKRDGEWLADEIKPAVESGTGGLEASSAAPTSVQSTSTYTTTGAPSAV